MIAEEEAARGGTMGFPALRGEAVLDLFSRVLHEVGSRLESREPGKAREAL
jgi:hypothetical protein